MQMTVERLPVGMDAETAARWIGEKSSRNGRCRMSTTKLSLSELAKLAPSEQQQKLEAFAASRNRPLNGEAQSLTEKITSLESRYEMSSETMRRKLSLHEIKETADICTWLMLLDAQQAIATPAL